VTETNRGDRLHEVGIVIPVYRGETTLPPLLAEIATLHRSETKTPGGYRFRVAEVILVHDCGPDSSDLTITKLCEEYSFVHAVWLARNFGQHAATIAGIANSTSTWIVTADEDGQHSPADIALLLDEALTSKVALVYGVHADGAPHKKWRNLSSRVAKRLAGYAMSTNFESISSFRLILGAYGRSVAAYCGPRIYLDVALTWAVPASASTQVSTRPELREKSGYSITTLIRHFLNLVISTGIRPLRLVSSIGVIFSFLGVIGSFFIVVRKFTTDNANPGWASVFMGILVSSGIILLTLGTLAEYIGAILLSSQGRPLYIEVDENARGPLDGR
jgi:polyisoprenyl-phosphate glycosyltransferase